VIEEPGALEICKFWFRIYRNPVIYCEVLSSDGEHEQVRDRDEDTLSPRMCP